MHKALFLAFSLGKVNYYYFNRVLFSQKYQGLFLRHFQKSELKFVEETIEPHKEINLIFANHL